MNMNERNCIYVMKSMAIFCVVCAHVAAVPEGANIWNRMASDFLNYMGTMGVPIFFLLSGYLFEKNGKKFGEFWRGKATSLFIPWLFCETLLWLYVVLRKGGITLKAWMLFMLGYQHTSYYLTVLVVLYLVFWRVKRDWEIVALILVSIFSMICTGWGFGIAFINGWTGTFYLNPLNWMCFFAGGMLIGRKKYRACFAAKLGKVVPLLALASVLYFVVIKGSGGVISYFSKYAFVAHVVNISLMFGLTDHASRISGLAKEIAIYVGKISFSIYLLHQFAAGIMVWAANHFDIFILTLLRPFAVIMIVAGMVWIGDELCRERFRMIRILIGLR